MKAESKVTEYERTKFQLKKYLDTSVHVTNYKFLKTTYLTQFLHQNDFTYR